MLLSTPLSPRTGSGLFEFLTAWTRGAGHGQWRPPAKATYPPEAAGPQTVAAPNVGRGRAAVPERKGVPGMVPRPPPPSPPPSVVHNPGRLFKEFSTRVLVIYLDSAHPPCPASCLQGGG